MNTSVSAGFVILLALLAANLPFMNERILAAIPFRFNKMVKPLWLHFLELFVLYMGVGIVAHLLETRESRAYPQGWEFYAVTWCLFVVLAYPGFVWRYLRRKHS